MCCKVLYFLMCSLKTYRPSVSTNIKKIISYELTLNVYSSWKVLIHYSQLILLTPQYYVEYICNIRLIINFSLPPIFFQAKNWTSLTCEQFQFSITDGFGPSSSLSLSDSRNSRKKVNFQDLAEPDSSRPVMIVKDR